MSIDTSVGRVDGVRVSIDTSVQVSGQGSVSRRPPGEDSLRAAGAFSRKFGGYSDKGAFCISSYNTLMSPLKVDPTQTRP